MGLTGAVVVVVVVVDVDVVDVDIGALELAATSGFALADPVHLLRRLFDGELAVAGLAVVVLGVVVDVVDDEDEDDEVASLTVVLVIATLLVSGAIVVVLLVTAVGLAVEALLDASTIGAGLVESALSGLLMSSSVFGSGAS